MPDIEKIIGLVFQTGTNVWQAVQQVQSRLTWVSEIRHRGGDFGLPFRLAYEWPQHFYRWSLGTCSLAGLLALLGSVLKILNVERLRILQVFFNDYWLTIIAIGALLFLLTVVNGITWIPILALSWVPTRWFPRLLESPSWLYVRWFCNIFEKPRPLVIRQLGIDAAADVAIERLVAGKYKTDNFAEKPRDLTDDERANAALFGCLLEQEHYVRKWKRQRWGPFYAAIASAQRDGLSLFAPDFVKSVSKESGDYYSIIREAVNSQLTREGQNALPDSAVTSGDFKEAVGLLVAEYDGSAANLATVTSEGTQWDLRRALKNARQFPQFSKGAMTRQFLKLAVRWDVWPGIEPGNFIYPFSLSLAALLLDREAIVTLQEAKSFSFDSTEERLIGRETMRRIVNTVARLLQEVHRDDYHTFYESLRREPLHPVEWELAQYVDFVLWSEAYDLAGKDGLQNWKVEGGFIKRKKPEEAEANSK